MKQHYRHPERRDFQKGRGHREETVALGFVVGGFDKTEMFRVAD